MRRSEEVVTDVLSAINKGAVDYRFSGFNSNLSAWFGFGFGWGGLRCSGGSRGDVELFA